MSVTGILFFIAIAGWNLYKAFVKSQENQRVSHRSVEREETRSQAETSYANPYGIPVASERAGGISEGQTVEWTQIEQESKESAVEPTVHESLSILHESEREIVHTSVQVAATHREPATKPHKQLLHKQNLKQAIILSEVLGEPRAKRPWRPNRQR